jgi:hypothetical protein
MSARLISLSPDLLRLRDDGYEVAVLGGFLVIHNVPYVDANRQVRRGKLVSELSMAGDITVTPNTHVAHFVGEHPCDHFGHPLTNVVIESGAVDLGAGSVTSHMMSNKPPEGYPDYHEKMSAYVALISNHASALDPSATARTFSVVESTEEASPFCYIDTASSRAGVVDVSAKLKGQKIGIVGLGGTGSYILDFVAKTPVKEIHIFDDDVFLQHNGFRAPGAATIDDLRAREPKVVRYHRIYSQLKRGVVPHCLRVNASNVDLLRDMDFVFLSLDAGADKAAIIGALEDFGVPFVDVGMGIDVVNGSLLGIVRVTTSTPAMRDHVRAKGRIPLAGDGMENMYERNIQIGELNALNASLAVIRWKKHLGFYKDFEHEHFTAYTIDGNHLLNEDAA